MQIRSLFAPALVVGALTLGGCSLPGIPIPGLPGVEVNDGGYSLNDGDTTINVGPAVAMPGDFPSELPVPDGQLISAVAGEGAWTLVFDGADKGDVDELAEYFKSNGFTVNVESDIGSAWGGNYSNDSYNVTINWDGNSALAYAVQVVAE